MVVLAWGIAHDEVRLLLPIDQDTLKAVTQELLVVRCSAGSIRNIWSDYEGTMAVGVYKRKQDQARKGLYPRVGSTVTNRLRAFVEELGLEVSDECSKERTRGARCRTGPPVFPRAVNGTEHSRPVSRQQVTNAVLNSLRMLEADTTHFSGLSTRRGGISAALVARVPEPILFVQSGHGFNNAARNYMAPRNLHIRFETYNAFGI
jgi:hypothetical protein